VAITGNDPVSLIGLITIPPLLALAVQFNGNASQL
jgi:hypothetical protein